MIVDEWFARHYDPSRHTKDQGYGLALGDALTDTSFEYIRDEVRRRHAPAP